MSKQFFKGTLIGAAIAGAIAYAMSDKKLTKKDIKEASYNLYEQLAKEMNKYQKISQAKYELIIDQAIKDYPHGKKVSKKILKDIAKELKEGWEDISDELKEPDMKIKSKRIAKQAQKVLKKVGQEAKEGWDDFSDKSILVESAKKTAAKQKKAFKSKIKKSKAQAKAAAKKQAQTAISKAKSQIAPKKTSNKKTKKK